MIRKILAISKNTFTETLRQPIFSVIVFIALLILILSPSITMYSIDDDNKLLKELGLSTLFLTGLFISIFSSVGAITEELESKTAMTVISKPVPRWGFVLGKFFGIVGAVAIAHLITTYAMMMCFRHGVMSTASDLMDFTVITIGAVILISAILISAIMNYSYDWSFTASCMGFFAILGTIGMLILTFIDQDWKFNPAKNDFTLFDIYASILLFLAVIVLISVAILFSTRFNVIMTLILCVAVFLLGLISDYVFGRYADIHIWAKVGRLLLPNLQVFWISDAIYEESKITIGYVGKAALYAVSYSAGLIALAAAMFQSKQIGKQ